MAKYGVWGIPTTSNLIGIIAMIHLMFKDIKTQMEVLASTIPWKLGILNPLIKIL